MAQPIDEPTLTGTPDQWWKQAETITEAEAADRVLGTWYIADDDRASAPRTSYRISTPTMASNESRKAALRRDIERGRRRAEDISPKVRALIRVPIEAPEWLSADLVMADLAVGSDERGLWRKTPTRWQLVFDGRIAVSELTMAQLRPTIATVTAEEPDAD